MGGGARLELLYRRDQPLDIFRPRQPVIAVLDKRQHYIVTRKARHQFDGMIKRTTKTIREHRGTKVLFKTDGDNIKKYFLPNA